MVGDSTAILESSKLAPPLQLVKSTALPPGRISGQRWEASPFLRSRMVRGFGVPPAAETRNRPELKEGVSMMLSSGPQLAPRTAAALQRVKAAPPLSETFFSLPSAKNPNDCPSGEKNGLSAPSVPGIGVASRRSIGRT